MNLAILLALVPAAPPADATFFETKVRPALVAHCAKCHSGTKAKAGFRVDSRTALLAGGDSGPGVVLDKADGGTFLSAIGYADPDRAMPPKGKLPDAIIRDLETWVKAGAVWPDSSSESVPGVAKPAFDLASRKAAHWAWQPLAPTPPPTVRDPGWVRDPADAFVLSKLEAKGLSPAAPAPPLAWLRRVTFALTGLPPTLAEQDAFTLDHSPTAREVVVDRLLASPAYGEAWGRHWLDLARYAESRGHESDYDIPNAYQYRDYVVRALNADVPYDQFVREQIAGDVLANPRLNPKTGANESVVGSAFWHLGEEVHSPVDLRQDQADRIDNRIDVFGKAVLGVTVACARCHDHKFDAIAAADYAALFGLLQPQGIRQVRIDGWEANRSVATELARLRGEAVAGLPSAKSSPNPALAAWLASAQLLPPETPDDVTMVRRAAGDVSLMPDGGARIEERDAWVLERFWDKLSTVPGTQRDPTKLGQRVPAGFTVRTPAIAANRKKLYALVRGGGTLYAAVCGHSTLAGPLHQHLVSHVSDTADYRWVSIDLTAYRGMPLHVEFTAQSGTDFALATVALADTPPPAPSGKPPTPVTLSPERRAAYVTGVEALRSRAVWQSRIAPAAFDGSGYDEAIFLRGSPRSSGAVIPRRGPEAIFGPTPLSIPSGSGRAELAAQLTDPTRNPLLARVAVNRVWHHLFGRGIVPTVDNFGVLGEQPTHPALLDTLAADFARDSFSQKRLIRRLVLSATYAMDSAGDDSNADPTNALLHRFRLKRLDAEAIRDNILSASGRLDRAIGGQSIPVHLTEFLTGRGRPSTVGPVDGAGRRSLYLSVRRNFPEAFLQAFDLPTPFTAVGRRQVSNVPAQALALSNAPFAHGEAQRWGTKLAATPGPIPERIRTAFRTAMGRVPSHEEVATCAEGLSDTPAGWGELAHALFTAKEFVFVR